MDYFDKLEWVWCNSRRETTEHIDKVFEDYWTTGLSIISTPVG